jgi:hypothetical protein
MENNKAVTAQEIVDMKNWIKDCSWGENMSDKQVDQLADAVVIRGIERHYFGGVEQFRSDSVAR